MVLLTEPQRWSDVSIICSAASFCYPTTELGGGGGDGNRFKLKNCCPKFSSFSWVDDFSFVLGLLLAKRALKCLIVSEFRKFHTAILEIDSLE